MLILKCLLDLISKKADRACAFLYTHLDPDEIVFVEVSNEVQSTLIE